MGKLGQPGATSASSAYVNGHTVARLNSSQTTACDRADVRRRRCSKGQTFDGLHLTVKETHLRKWPLEMINTAQGLKQHCIPGVARLSMPSSREFQFNAHHLLRTTSPAEQPGPFKEHAWRFDCYIVALYRPGSHRHRTGGVS